MEQWGRRNNQYPQNRYKSKPLKNTKPPDTRTREISSKEEELFLNPYNFVDVSGPTPTYPLKTNEKFHSNSGYIDVEFKTVTPLFIPSPEEKTLFNGSHKKMKFFHYNGEPLLPSTSIKGWLRSTVEILSNSCFPHDCHQVARKPHRFSIAEILEQLGKTRCNTIKALCPACHMFGGVNFKEMNDNSSADQGKKVSLGGKISVGFGECLKHDGFEEEVTLKPLGEPHPGFYRFYVLDNRKTTNGTGIDKPMSYDSREVKLGRKVYLKHDPESLDYRDDRQSRLNVTVQLLKPGAVFRTRIHYFNLSHYELGLLLNSLDLRHDGRRLDAQLGMGKPLGLGRIKIEGIQVTKIDRVKRYSSLTGKDKGESPMGELEIAKYIDIFQRIQVDLVNSNGKRFDPESLNEKDIAGYEIKPAPGFAELPYVKELLLLKQINDGIPLKFPIKYPSKKEKKKDTGTKTETEAGAKEMKGFKWFMEEKDFIDQRLFHPLLLVDAAGDEIEIAAKIPLYNWGQECKK